MIGIKQTKTKRKTRYELQLRQGRSALNARRMKLAATTQAAVICALGLRKYHRMRRDTARCTRQRRDTRIGPCVVRSAFS